MKQRTDIASLLADAAKVSTRAAALAAQGQVAEALDLESQADRLRAKARRFSQRTGTANPVKGTSLAEAKPSQPASGTRTERNQSTRSVTVSALSELGVPMSPRAVAEYSWARFGTEIDHRALASLRRDEWRGWSSPRSTRAVYVVPALEGRRFLAVRGKVALSEWPLERRLIGPWSERVDHLAATIQLARHLKWLFDFEPNAAERLKELVMLYAATVPGAHNQAGLLDPLKIRDAAEAELSALGPKDKEWRADAADRARQILDEDQQVWGAPPLHTVERSG
jgi:hypothetical protein